MSNNSFERSGSPDRPRGRVGTESRFEIKLYAFGHRIEAMISPPKIFATESEETWVRVFFADPGRRRFAAEWQKDSPM